SGNEFDRALQSAALADHIGDTLQLVERKHQDMPGVERRFQEMHLPIVYTRRVRIWGSRFLSTRRCVEFGEHRQLGGFEDCRWRIRELWRRDYSMLILGRRDVDRLFVPQG